MLIDFAVMMYYKSEGACRVSTAGRLVPLGEPDLPGIIYSDWIE